MSTSSPRLIHILARPSAQCSIPRPTPPAGFTPRFSPHLTGWCFSARPGSARHRLVYRPELTTAEVPPTLTLLPRCASRHWGRPPPPLCAQQAGSNMSYFMKDNTAHNPHNSHTFSMPWDEICGHRPLASSCLIIKSGRRRGGRLARRPGIFAYFMRKCIETPYAAGG